ncbi:hypothetical protein K1719_007161 [Acacia pycnantha]|nr:hypothetical protein K1719_007161 [Acacia pycnantha]
MLLRPSASNAPSTICLKPGEKPPTFPPRAPIVLVAKLLPGWNTLFQTLSGLRADGGVIGVVRVVGVDGIDNLDKRNSVALEMDIRRDGLTHNMLNHIHNHWKHAEAVRINCMGLPTMDMKNVCTQLEVSTDLSFMLANEAIEDEPSPTWS